MLGQMWDLPNANRIVPCQWGQLLMSSSASTISIESAQTLIYVALSRVDTVFLHRIMG